MWCWALVLCGGASGGGSIGRMANGSLEAFVLLLRPSGRISALPQQRRARQVEFLIAEAVVTVDKGRYR